MSRHPQDSRASVIAERYVLRNELGRGGCAVVYEAHDTRLGRMVALKMVKSSARDAQANARLAREARAGAAIHHPNVCGLSDAGYLQDGRPYLVMERLTGETLTSCLRRTGNLSSEHAVDLGLQLLSGLEAAHAIGIVHRDVKPDNVFLVPRNGCTPLVKLLDFGMCRRAASTSGDDRTLTRVGQVVGTPEYMSPEQVSGKRSFDGRIDLYAVGVILYECLSGQRAFPGKDAREVVVSVLVKSLPPLRHFRPDVPEVLDRVIAKAMERDANARYATAQQFMADLVEAKRQMQEKRRAMMQTGPRRIEAPRSIVPPRPVTSDSDDWDNMPTQQLHQLSRPARTA